MKKRSKKTAVEQEVKPNIEQDASSVDEQRENAPVESENPISDQNDQIEKHIDKSNDKYSEQELPRVEELKKELKRVRYKRRFRRLLRSTVNALIVVAAIAALVATLLLPVLQIAGTSMEPTLDDGDIVLLVKKKDLKTGDLCAFYYSNKILIKRVIATPGDYIWIEEDGTVFLNGNELKEPYVSEKALGECDVEFPYQVPENAYFVMGDKRETSIDSRSSTIGCVPEDQIVGKIFCKFWPLTEFKFIS